MEKYYLAALTTVIGIGSVRVKKLVEYFGSAQQAWFADKQALIQSKHLDGKTCDNLVKQRDCLDIHKFAESILKKSINIYSIFDEDYPCLLKQTFNPPPILYCRGKLPDTRNIIAIVGARKASAYGKNAANMLAAELSKSGFYIISGAARGIDTCAHLGALPNRRTIAVLGCGVDVAYPPENANLLSQIAECGAIVSEYPPGTAPHPGFFPARNRIISGFSRAAIIVEAAARSGSLITADFALEEGRDVFAVPGSIFSKTSEGTHNLIKQGAKLIDSANDIFQEYNITTDKQQAKQAILSEDEQKVYNNLSFDAPISVEEIVVKTKLPASTVTYILLQFQLGGMIVEHGGQYYVKVAREGL